MVGFTGLELVGITGMSKNWKK